MCGISGFVDYNSKIKVKNYYNAHIKISHRGPDDEGFMLKVDNQYLSFNG